jgi:hypothetical protein
MATTKLKLPVLQSAPEEESRPRWQWVGFGTVMTFTAWLPLAYLGTTLVARVEPREGGAAGASVVGSLLAMVVPLVLAAAAGGYLVGRFGKPAGVREALLAGLVTGLAAILVTALSGPLSLASPAFLLVVVIATAASGGGGALGVRQRVV